MKKDTIRSVRKYFQQIYTVRSIALLSLFFTLVTWRLIVLLPSTETTETTEKLLNTLTESHWLINTEVRYYNLSIDPLYHYELRYQLSQNVSSHRLMLLLGGHKRICSDWWTFSVGRRLLSTIRAANYTILSVCSPRTTLDHNFPIEDNLDVKWIYKSLQIWMNDVYYAKYQRYPSLYIYGVSRGSHFAGLLCRVLPVQAQILYIYPGYHEGMTVRSTHKQDLQTRLTLDRAFASWFVFKYCYETESDVCLFHGDQMQSNFHPVPPTYFVHVSNDAKLTKMDYLDIISVIRNDAFELGGILLKDKRALQVHVAFPPKATPSYMQEHFYPWHNKPHASRLLYEHLLGFPKLPEQQNTEYKFQTFWCHHGDFTYFERFPSIMKSWSEREQEEYRDYTNDIRTYHELLTEEFCGDLSGQHAMLSLDLDHALTWVLEIDHLRQRLQLQALVSRPVRIWMYEKATLVPEPFQNHHITANCSYHAYSNRMYLGENLIQDHFQSSTHIENPLLADYFLIPHDLYCFIFFDQLFANFTNAQFKAHVSNYSQNYFEPLLNHVRSKFPYWTMSDQPGANHIVTFVGGRNMGVLDEHVQKTLRYVIQLGPTGIRQDLLRRHAAELYLHRNLSTVYRHAYDIVIPPFTPTELRIVKNSNDWYEKKTKLLFFAGALNHSLSSRSARSVLEMFAYNRSNHLIIEKKLFTVITIVNGYMTPETYANAIMSSVFALCPEGYSPWTPRIYEAINLGSIPLVLADGIVLPFERFIPWRSFSLKLNVSKAHQILELIVGNKTSDFEKHIRKKKSNADRYMHAFRWFSTASSDKYGDVFYYVDRELQCRRLEQMMGATSDVQSEISRQARAQVCRSYSDLCPCIHEPSLAFDQYSYD